jgi:sigma-B regulation protein RsbU (phosphoserine phosphatase)
MLVVGDVTGKGLKAAARTIEAKYALRAFAQDCIGPAENVTHLNNYICLQHPFISGESSQFIALSIAIVNPISGILRAISAGAEPPFIVRAVLQVDEIPTSGLMLGVEPGFNYTESDQTLNAGDILVLTTDGITEVRRDGVFFGCEGIAKVVRDASASMSLHDIGTSIVTAAREFGNGQFKDDICILLARPT